MLRFRDRRGFTIIELLITIVVIGILAAGAVVVFAGIRERAIATKVAATADAYAKAIKYYRSENGRYPAGPTPVSPHFGDSCLGNVSDFPAEGALNNGECFALTSGGTWRMSVHQPTIDAITTHMRISNTAYPPVQFGNELWRGIVYSPNSTTLAEAFIEWRVKGDQRNNCGATKSSPYTAYDSSARITTCKILLQ